MSFLSRLASRRDRQPRTPKRTSSDTAAPQQDLLPLRLPSSSLLADASLANPLLLSSPTSHAGGARDDDLRSLRSVDTTPWVHVDADSPAKPRQAAHHRSDPAREKRERVRLEKARLSPGEVTLLLDECGSVIRLRGLTTLGLFRPYRAAESRPAIRALCIGFLDYVAECAARPAGQDDVRGTEASKAVLLHAFREELRYAGVHDVVAVLKWGLRHLAYPPGISFSGPVAPSLDWYTTFVARTTPIAPPHAFSAFLLPSLPPPSQSLLLSALALVQAVAAHAQENAMPASRLCRLLASYVFGLAPSSASSFEAAQETFRAVGDALEGALRAFLAEQADLPPRLKELLHPRPNTAAAEPAERTVRVLRVELETRGEWDAAGIERTNDQRTGRAPGADQRTPARRAPLEVLRSALAESAPGGDDAVAQAWEALRACARERGSEALLDEEVCRVLDLLGLGAAGDSHDAPFALLTPDGRARTQSHNHGAAQDELGGLGARFPNRSAGNLRAPTTTLTGPESWDVFASSGFTAAPSGEFGLLSQAQLLHRAESIAAAQRRARPAPVSRLVSVSLADVDEAFGDLWLDTLDETTSPLSPCASWPSIVLAPLQRDAAARLAGAADHLLVVEILLPVEERRSLAGPVQSALAPPALGRANSSASAGTHDGIAFPGRKWRRRASAIFSPSSTSLVEPAATAEDDPAPRRARKSLGRPATADSIAPPAPPLSSARAGAASGPGTTFVRSISQGFASARRKASRQSMHGTPAPVPFPSPLDELELPPVSPLPLHVGEQEPGEVQGYEVVTPQGSPVVPRSDALLDAGDARAGVPPLGRVVGGVPSPVMEEQELFDGPEEMQGLSAPTTTVDPLSGSPTHLDSQPLAPQQSAPFSNFTAVNLGHEEPLAAVGVPQLERAAAREEPALELEQDSRVPTGVADGPALHDGESEHLAEEDGPPLPRLPETVGLPAVHQAQELVAQPLAPEELAGEEHHAHEPSAEASATAADSLAVDQPETIAPATPSSPLVTLSPPPGDEAKVLPDVPMAGGVRGEAASEAHGMQAAMGTPDAESPIADTALGLGLVNAPIPPTDPEPAAPATPKKDEPRLGADPHTPRTPASPAISANAALSPVLSHGSQSSLGVPKSPTPSNSSTGSRKFLASVGGFLKRKKSNVDKEQVRREKADAAREKEEAKQLRKLREEELRREIKERKAPTPVSNVKARVREIEEEHAATGAVPTSPTTPSRIRTASSPRPGTPTRSLSRPVSVASLRASASKPAPPESALPSLPLLPAVGEGSANDAAAVTADPAERSLAVGEPAGLEAPVTAAEDEHTGVIAPPPVVSPAQESQHLHVKVPAALDDLPSPIPSPTPHPPHDGRVAPLAAGDDLTEPIPNVVPPVFAVADSEPVARAAGEGFDAADGGEEHTAVLPSIDVSSPGPKPQTPEHLYVKVPSALADLPPPSPSPTPRADEDGCEADVLAEDVTETIPELKPPVFAAAVQPGTAGDGEEPAGDVSAAGSDAAAFGDEGRAEPRLVPHDDEGAGRLNAQYNSIHGEPILGAIVHAAERGMETDQLQEPPSSAASGAFDSPLTPTKPSSAAQNGTPAAHATPIVRTNNDVFSASATPSAADATPTKPTVPQPPVLHTASSQRSMSTTRSFETADSSAQSSMTTSEHWAAPSDVF